MSSEWYRWMLVEDFVANCNNYRMRTFEPGGRLEADESVICWYGIGGAYVNAGLPMYLALKRKPDNGGEIQNLVDVKSEIMLRLKIVKSTKKEKALIGNATDDAQDEVGDNANNAKNSGKGTKVFLELIEPYFGTSRLVTIDAYFASVECTLSAKAKGLLVIANAKQYHKGYPMEYLGNVILPKQGAQSVVASFNEETGRTELVAIIWVDQNRQFLSCQRAD